MQEQQFIINQEQAEIVNQKPVPNAQEIEFLEKYEIKTWEFSPRLYKILAASAVFNMLALLVFAQTNVLQARACDSPWVNRVCQVLDTVYLGTTILSNDSEFVSRPYEKTELEDAEIVWINQTGTEPLNYPEGYFALANPEDQLTAMQDPTLANSGFESYQNYTPPATNFPTPAPMPVTPSPNFNLPPQKLPPAAKNQIIIPDNLIGDNPIGNNPRKGKNAKPEDKKPDEDDTAKNENRNSNSAVNKEDKTKNDTVEDKSDKFNSKPLEDWGSKYAQPILNKEIDVNAPFTVIVTAKLDENGKLVKPIIAAEPGSDEKMTEVAKEAISAFSDTKLLKPLYDIGGREVIITFSQNADNLQAIIKTKTKSPNSARTLQSNLNLIIKSAAYFMKKDSDEAKLMSRAQLGTEDNFLIINFLIENEEKTQMIEKSLKSLQEKLKKNPLDSGLADNVNLNPKASK